MGAHASHVDTELLQDAFEDAEDRPLAELAPKGATKPPRPSKKKSSVTQSPTGGQDSQAKQEETDSGSG